VDKTLNFIQFCLGAALLLVSVPSIRVSLVNVITDYVNNEIQVSEELALLSDLRVRLVKIINTNNGVD